MRISTGQMYEMGVASMSRQQTQMLHTQQQLSLGKRLVVPADDPVAAAQAVNVSASKAVLNQYQANIGVARDALGANDSLLGQVTDAMQSLRTIAVSAGNPALTDSDRTSMATQAQSILDQLTGLANSRDGDGRFMFAGFAVDRQPFTVAAGGVNYTGDRGTRSIEVGSSPFRISPNSWITAVSPGPRKASP